MKQAPLVSIVVVNRDGAAHLRRLLAGLAGRTDYSPFELIVVDNGSSDESLDLLREASAPFSISLAANAHNESFSDACNQGARLASGELLLFLNNDTEPFETSWLDELVDCLRRSGAGVAGSTLLRPAEDSESGYRVQHRAIRIVEEDGLLRPDRRGFGVEPFGEGFGEDESAPFPSGACLLIERELFDRVDGFTHGYVYGGEDVDLGLKAIDAGRAVLCSGRSLLIHHLGATRAKDDNEQQHARASGNERLFRERWGPRLRREFELDRLAGGGAWAAADHRPPPGAPSRDEVLALGFCLKSSEPAPETSGSDPLAALRDTLARRGHRCLVLREESLDDLRGFDYDVAVHLRGPARYAPRPSQLNVLWTAGDSGEVAAVDGGPYQLAWSGDDTESLLDAVLARAAELRFPKRIGSAGE